MEFPWPIAPSLPDQLEFNASLYPASPLWNGALVRYKDRWIQTVRTGWDPFSSGNYLGELGINLKPLRLFRKISPSDPDAHQEDMRLWTYQEKLFGSYTFYTKTKNHDYFGCPIFVDICLIDTRDLVVTRTWQPRIKKQNHWEKNWVFFEYEGGLYFVYTIAPHVVYRYRFGGPAELVGETETRHNWAVTLRGGTPPIRVGDRYVSIFHDNTRTRMGWYEFEAKPPFKVIRVGENHIMMKPGHIVFPMGLFQYQSKFYCTYGEDDCRLKMFRWKH